MNILIAGSGAVGGYYGARLQAAGHQVYFLARGAQLVALNQGGLSIESIDGNLVLPSVIAMQDTPTIAMDLIILAVKSFQTKDILAQLKPAVSEKTQILSLQNGIDNEEQIAAAFSPQQTIGGVSFIGAELVAPGRIAHTAAGNIIIGPWDFQQEQTVQKWAELFNAANITTAYSNNIRQDLWQKLLWNAAFNTATCLSGTTAKQMLDFTEGLALIKAAMQEVILVAQAEGIILTTEMADAYITRTAAIGEVRTSMLVDREKHRPIEVEAISGSVLRRALQYGLLMPIQQTFYALLKAYDQHR